MGVLLSQAGRTLNLYLISSPSKTLLDDNLCKIGSVMRPEGELLYVNVGVQVVPKLIAPYYSSHGHVELSAAPR